MPLLWGLAISKFAKRCGMASLNIQRLGFKEQNFALIPVESFRMWELCTDCALHVFIEDGLSPFGSGEVEILRPDSEPRKTIKHFINSLEYQALREWLKAAGTVCMIAATGVQRHVASGGQ